MEGCYLTKWAFEMLCLQTPRSLQAVTDTVRYITILRRDLEAGIRCDQQHHGTLGTTLLDLGRIIPPMITKIRYI